MTNADESKVTRPAAEAGAVEPVAMKPCPWCGGEVGPVVEEGARFRWRRVTGCCAEGPEVRHDTMADDQAAAEVESRAAAIAAWNNRPVEDTLRAQLEAAEAEVSGMRARMFYLATDGCVEGFVHVNRDVYDFASEMAELAAREEPNDDDLVDGFCQLIDAARTKAGTP